MKEVILGNSMEAGALLLGVLERQKSEGLIEYTQELDGSLTIGLTKEGEEVVRVTTRLSPKDVLPLSVAAQVLSPELFRVFLKEYLGKEPKRGE